MTSVQWVPTRNFKRGDGYGYAIFIERLRERLSAHIRLDDDASVAIHVCAPHCFDPVVGKTNVLVTMFESPDMPADCIRRVQGADCLIVPSAFCQRIFRPLVSVPVYVVPLGVETVPYVQRSYPADRPFRYLWLGAFNVRKGWTTLSMGVWDRYFRNRSDVELYVKTTTPKAQGPETAKIGNALYDARNVSFDELCDIYAQAHCFVFPSLGEGFGQTLAESMSSGLPCIAPEYGGYLEFADRHNCYFVPHVMKRLTPGRGAETAALDSAYAFAVTDPRALAQAMERVRSEYGNALVVGKRAAKNIRRFTWDACAVGVVRVLRETIRRAA